MTISRTIIQDMSEPYAGKVRSASSDAGAGQPRLALAVAAMFALLLLVALGPYASTDTVPSAGGGSLMRQLSYGLVFAAAVMAMQVTHDPRRLLTIPVGVVLTLGWCWLSLAWALDPSAAVRRITLTTLVIWTVFITVPQLGYEKTVTVMRRVLLLVLIANYGAVIASPSFGIHQVAQVGDPGLVGNWRGILMQKNFAGAFCAFTIIAYAFDARGIRPILRWLVIAAAAYFLYMTSSKTSMRLTGLALGVGYLYSLYNPRYLLPLICGAAMLSIVLMVLGVSYWEELLAPFERQDALTGRGGIWLVLLTYAQDHWLLGAGYGSFWNIGPVGPVYRYSNDWVVEVGNGHNGYLDLLVQIGAPGLVLAVATLILWPILKLAAGTATRTRGPMLMAFMLFCAGHNMTESSLLDRDSIVQVFLVLTIALIEMETSRQSGAPAELREVRHG
ncbi:O-antigen ligase family protein [Microvirga sesbaniae]|uniref:O-antigen ligase family protein n=1 Tax=Microvirga sesbaniae TaxID=681392 RepID=UPI0021CA49EB|nr:O-antigen ligase family protein [Microvirga sp. HBU67692]